MCAARVVADHPAKAAVIVGGRIRPPGQPVVAFANSRVAQFIAHRSGQNPRPALSVSTSRTPCIYFDQSMTTATLQHWPAKLVPPAARKKRRAKSPASSDRPHYVFFRCWNDNADRDLPVVGSVDGVHGLAAGIEANLAVHGLSQLGFQAIGINGCSRAPVDRRERCLAQFIRCDQRVIAVRHVASPGALPRGIGASVPILIPEPALGTCRPSQRRKRMCDRE